MGVPQPAPVAADPSAETRPEYDAFFSYTSGADAKLVRRTERFIESFHRRRLLRRLQLKPLTICVDGSDIRPRFGDAIESVDETLRRYVVRSRRLVVFCSPAAARSRYVDGEIRAFLETHPPGAVLPVVTHGDPSADAATVFPPALREGQYDKAIWLDFRGGATWPWQRRSMRLRPFREERVKLAAELHGRGPDILPAWKRAETIRRRVTAATVVAAVAVVVAAAMLGTRSYAQRIARDVTNALDGGTLEPIQSLEQRAAGAVSLWHDSDTEAAFRLAASTIVHRGGTATLFPGPFALSAGSGAAARIANGGLEVTSDLRGGDWRHVNGGPFALVDISDDGRAVAALGDELMIWRGGTATRCDGRPAGAAARSLALDPTGQTVTALFQSGDEWSLLLDRVDSCGTRALVLKPLWTAVSAGGVGAGIQGNPGRPPRVVLSHGGRAVAASSEAGWLLARIGDGTGATMEPLNGVLDAALQSDRADATAPDALIVLDEAFSGDGRYAAVAPAPAHAPAGSRRRGPRAVLIPLQDTAPAPIQIDGSRGAQLIALARMAPLVAYALEDHSVRVWDWTGNSASVGGNMPTEARPGALSFGAGDRLLLVADRAAESSLYAFDAGSGAGLTSLNTHRQAASVTVGGANGERALVRFEDPARGYTGSDLVELRPPRVLARWPTRTERLRAGVLLRASGVGVTNFAKTLRIAQDGNDAMHDIPLAAAGLQLAAVPGAVAVLLDDGHVMRCSIAERTCEEAGPIDRERRAIAADEKGALFSGCVNGGVVPVAEQCRTAAPVDGLGPVEGLAVSSGGVLRISSGKVCVGQGGLSSPCDYLGTNVERIMGAAVSSDGSLAAIGGSSPQGGRVDLYKSGVRRWLPWPAWGFASQSQIPVRGTVLAVRFLKDDSWLRVAAVWNAELVVQCVPIAGTAFSLTRCPDE